MTTLEEARAEIQQKYNRVGATVLGSIAVENTREVLEGGVYYCITDNAVIIFKEDIGWYYVTTTPGFFRTYVIGGLCSGLGVPQEDPRLNPDGQGQRQRFTNGQIYWHPDLRRASIIKNGDFWSKFQELGWEQGPLGYPTLSRTSVKSASNGVDVFRAVPARVRALRKVMTQQTSP